ncbi:MAG: c-type cytochrome domain-containing protein [Motiliproteus sp.]
MVFSNAAFATELVLASDSVSYPMQVKPLLQRLCVDCHSGWFADAGLKLDTLENISKGGRNGAVVFPGEPEKGRFINLMRPVKGRFSNMPPGPVSVTAAEFEMLQRWIAQGAR